jgi:hypothetical protein
MRSKAKEYLIKDLFLGYIDGYDFKRFDIIINYLAIENYYGKNAIGWEFHNRYDETGGFNDPVEAKERFIELIKNFEKTNAFLASYPVLLSDLVGHPHIRDGAHRTACAIYFGCDKIFGRLKNPRKRVNQNKVRKCNYLGVKHLAARGFTQEEIEIIKDKKDEILKKIGL